MNKLYLILFISTAGLSLSAQSYEGKYLEANYDESRVPEYTLPGVLTSFAGNSIRNIEEWEQVRRPEIIGFFAKNIYGEVPIPELTVNKSFQLISEDSTILGGLCTRRDVLISLENERGKVSMPLVLFVPNGTEEKVPVIILASGEDIRRRNLRLDNPQAFGRTRSGIPLHQLMTRGIGLATIDYLAFSADPRHPEGKVRGGIAELFFEEGQNYTKNNEWGMIAIWAYALRAGMDYLESYDKVHPGQVATMGCSIGGKVALWAAVCDQRFGMTLLATAGHGGDAIWRREYGETLQNMCDYLPTWVCKNAGTFAANVHEMPVDQHSLLATMAPRPFYVSSAQHDQWADPEGQWIGTYSALLSYKLYGKEVALKSPERPKINQPIIKSSIGFHIRSGVHGLELYDWEQFMKFIEYHFMDIDPRSVEEVYHVPSP